MKRQHLAIIREVATRKGGCVGNVDVEGIKHGKHADGLPPFFKQSSDLERDFPAHAVTSQDIGTDGLLSRALDKF